MNELNEIELQVKDGRYDVPAERVAEAMIEAIVSQATETKTLRTGGAEFGSAFK